MALKVGDTNEMVVIENVSRTHIVKYAGASGDFNPLHHDDPVAQNMAGYPSVFAHGMLSMGLTGRLLTSWRYRHAQMVLRMLGRNVGTGGFSGYDYLHATAVKHHIFKDLHNISTLLIPRSELPPLPKELKEELGFYYTQKE